MFTVPFLNLSLYSLVVGLGMYMALGWLWYSPLFLGSVWREVNGIKKETTEMHYGHYTGALFVGLSIMSAQSYFFGLLGVTTCVASIQTSLILWLGFVASTQFSSVIFQKKPMNAFFIDAGFWAVSIILRGCAVATL
jgi:hypothetical protein